MTAPDPTDAPINGEDQTAPDFSKVPLSMDAWKKRIIQPKNFLLGEVLSTTTRALLAADTGLGKTHLGFAMGMAMATKHDFCHWKGIRRSRVLVIDGEMSEDLVQERLGDAERRLGTYPEGFFCLCKEHVPNMPPINTTEGQNWVMQLIAHLGDIDFLFLDNLGSLIVGSLQVEEDWNPILPFLFHLTSEKIGLCLVTHTGHDKSRHYGLKMQTWHMDTVIQLTALEGNQADIAFRLEFLKARQRKPSNRTDYEPANIVLEGDQWKSSPADKTTTATTKQPPQGYRRAKDVLDNILIDAETVVPSRDHVPVKAIRIGIFRNALCSEGILTKSEKGTLDSTQRTRWSNIKAFGVSANAWRMNNDWIWRI